jgi:hypothetical protein
MKGLKQEWSEYKIHHSNVTVNDRFKNGSLEGWRPMRTNLSIPWAMSICLYISAYHLFRGNKYLSKKRMRGKKRIKENDEGGEFKYDMFAIL